MTLILGIDTSCDDTSCAVASDGREILSNVVASQIADHSEFGGVVPEIACRRHIENIISVVRRALSDADCTLGDCSAIAVTQGPGLVGALLVGIGVAKAIAYSRGLPLVPVNHLEGHIISPLLTPSAQCSFPFVSLVVSGGHTSLYVARDFGQYELRGRTVDDAAGEAFDKVAKALSLGYPGGPVIERLASQSRGDCISFPSPMIRHDNYDFSFSGLKTAVLNYLRFELGIASPQDASAKLEASMVSRICAGFQQAVFDVLIHKTLRLAQSEDISLIGLGGGVSANAELRKRLSDAARERGLHVLLPPKDLSTDNAAMIACAAFHHLEKNELAGLDLDAVPGLAL
ncbi:MAG TPA: tRNA (adenosine(37)-N6)-threonylcarbamoyltransferase complex transferase subunit TsaD [bacterium]|nr:tRNA (adenosine(37)-N6)-threonylcarbamoyltransferase complex transferase subunit TsaD [bacterium]